jgi:hypothetical protein
MPTDLAFCTTEELVSELMRRKTFLGVVVHSEQEMRSAQWTGEKIFKVHLNENLDAAHAGRLLDTVAAYMMRQHG